MSEFLDKLTSLPSITRHRLEFLLPENFDFEKFERESFNRIKSGDGEVRQIKGRWIISMHESDNSLRKRVQEKEGISGYIHPLTTEEISKDQADLFNREVENLTN